MSSRNLPSWLESRTERALLWFQRAALFLLLIAALVHLEFLQALALAGILALHAAAYLAAPRINLGKWKNGLFTLFDILLATVAFYLTGDVSGWGGILGPAVAGIAAARLGLWLALTVGVGVWLLFTWPLIHSWIFLGTPLPFQVVWNLLIYLVLTFVVNYLVSMEARQLRVSRDASRRLQQLSTVYEVGRTITSILELEAVLHLVTAKAMEILNAEAGSLLLLDIPCRIGEEPGELVFRVALGPAGESLLGRRLAPGEGIAGVAVRSGEGQIVSDVHADPRWSGAPDAMTGFATQSIVCVPLLSRGYTIGALELLNKQDGPPFDEEDLSLLSTFATYAAVALENARLYEETNRRLQQIDTLYEVGRSLATLDTHSVLSTIAEQTVVALDVDLCGVFLHETDRLGHGLTVLRALHDPTGMASSLVGTRFDVREHPWLRELVRQDGYAAIGSVETDPRLDDRLRSMLQALGIRSCLFVGLYVQEQPRGVIVAAQRRSERSFSADEIQLCRALANQASIAVENARLYEQTDEALHKRLQELATIEEIDHELGTSLDYDRVINLVLERATQACRATFGAIGLLRAEGQPLEMRFWHTEQPEAAPLPGLTHWPTDQGIVGRVARSGQPALVADVRADPDYADVVSTTRSEVAVPIKREGRVIGVLNLESDRLAAFNEDDLHFLEHLAEHAAIAIDNARLFQQERQRAQMLSAIGDISREIGTGLDLERTLNLILVRLKDLMDYYIAEICLWQEEDQVLVTRASAGDPRYMSRTGGIYRLHEGFTGWIARHRQSLLIPDTTARTDVQPKVVAPDTPIRSYVGLPLKVGEQFVGTLELASDRVGAYSEEDVAFLQIFADQASVAIENARLFELQQRQLQEQVLLCQAGTALSSLDLDEVLRTVARYMAHALDVSNCSISSWDPVRNVVQTLVSEGSYLDLAMPASGEDVGVIYSLDEYPATAQVLHGRQPCVIQVTDPEADPAERALLEQLGQKSLLMIPLVARDHVVGLVELYEDRRVRDFSADEIRLCQALAGQAAIAIENARLYAAVQQAHQATADERDKLVHLHRVVAEAQRAETLTAKLQILADGIHQLGWGRVSLSLRDANLDPIELVCAGFTPEDEAALRANLLPGSEWQKRFSAQLDRFRIGQCYYLPWADPWVRENVRGVKSHLSEPPRPDVWHPQDLLYVPLYGLGGRIIGIIGLDDPQDGRRPTPESLAIIELFAQEIALIIDNAWLYERTDERLQAHVNELVALQRTTKELNATLDPDHILQVVLESAVHTTGATHGEVLLMDMETGLLTLRAALGYSDEEQAFVEERLLQAAEDSLIWQVVKSGQERIVGDAVQNGPLICAKNNTRSAMIVPIFLAQPVAEIAGLQVQYKGDVVGLINLYNTQPAAFGPDDLGFVRALADQAAVAIGNSIRFEEQMRLNTALSRRTEQMDSLLRVGQKMRADVPLEDTLEEIAYAIQETVGFNLVVISVAEGTPAVLRRVAAAGMPLETFEEMKRVRQPLERYERILREEYRQGACYFFPFQRREEWEAEIHVVTTMPEVEEWQEGQWHPHDMLLVPLRGAGGRLVGLISVDDPRDGRRPARQTLEVLTIFANQAAIAVENARLYADAQRRGDSLALINEVGRTLTQVQDPNQVQNIVVRAVSNLLHCELSAIFQPDPVDGRLAGTASYGVKLADMENLRFAPGEGLVGYVAATRTPLLIPDTEREPRFVAGPVPVGSMILVPIMVGIQLIGVLTAGTEAKYALTEADQMLLSTLADQAAVALESARLFASTQQAAVRLSLLNEIGRRAAAQLELQEMLDTAVSALHQILEYFRVAVFLVDEATQELYVAAANDEFWPVIPSGYRQKVGEGLIGLAAATGKTVLSPDSLTDERNLQVGCWSSRATLSVPIKIAGRVVGVLEAEAAQPNAFTEEDAAALEIAADQLAVAIQNARLFAESQRRVAELATINEIGRAISGALDADQLSELIHSQVGKLLDNRSFFIALYDAAAGLIRIIFAVENGRRESPLTLKLGQGLTSYLIRTGQPLLLNRDIESFIDEHGLTREGPVARSWLGVPMIAEDRVIGAIAVQSYEREDAFDEGHLRLLTTIAGQAAIAFQNASLFQERERRINELAVLNEVSQALSSTLELDQLLQTLYQQVSRLMDTTNFYIALYDEERDEITFPFVVDPEQREDWQPRRGNEGLTGRIISSRKPLLLPTGVAGIYRERGQEIKAGTCRSWLGVPMIAADKVLGVIAVQSYDQEYLYNQEHLNLLSTIAAQAAVAVRNAQLYQEIVNFSNELERRVEARTRDLEQALQDLTLQRDRAETLYRITSELGTSLELERVLQQALRLFADVLGVEHGTITLVDQETGHLHLRASLQRTPGLVPLDERTPLRRGVGLAGWILEHRKPALIADVTTDPRWVPIGDQESTIRSVVAAPLSVGGGDILGVLTLGHPEVGYFTEEHLQLVAAAGMQVAMAVNNSDLYAYITDQADQLGRMLQAQQAEAAKSRAILESIADGVLVLDHNGRVLLVNPAAEELLGFSALALQGEHFRHMLGLGETETDRELAQALYAELRQRLEAPMGDPIRTQVSTPRLAAGKRVLAVTIAPLITELGGAPGLVAALRDISREAEVERLKNEFISTVSHELRTPMTSIKGYTDLLFLGMAGGLSDAQRSFLQIIKSNADRLTALVNDILDISRIETGRIRLTIESLDLGNIISQVVRAFQEQYREKGVGLEWEEPEGLPQVRGDADRVTQILNNLLANAWQYTPSGGHVSVRLHERDGFLQVDVADTGIGIAAEDLPRVFDRFFRADHPVVQEAGGTGLGLAIVKMFVEMLGGEIWAESELGVGSVFSFTLPLASIQLPEAEIIHPDLIAVEAPPTIGRRTKVLVVEDDRDLALLLRRHLETEGYQVLLAGSGEDALWLSREEQPQLITLDIMLPDGDGFAVLERLKQNPVTAPIPVIIISVMADPARGYALGAVDYVVKPFDEEKLMESVHKALLPKENETPVKLLVVDDDLDILNFLDQALSFHGYRVWTAASGREALEQVVEVQPDLILLDIKMPGMAGYEVIRHLKGNEATQAIPIIVITASPVDKERDRVRVLGMGAAQYVTKPLSIELLVREIKMAIEERQLV